MIYDLSVVLENSTATYPTDPEVSVSRVINLDENGCNVSSISMGTHSGTHVDLPLHYINNAIDAASMPLESFCGEAVVFEIPFTNGHPVNIGIIDANKVKKGDILIIRTGWEQFAGKKQFFEEFPYFSENTGEMLKNLGVKAIGTDLPSVDNTGTHGIVPQEYSFPEHYDHRGIGQSEAFSEQTLLFQRCASKDKNGGRKPCQGICDTIKDNNRLQVFMMPYIDLAMVFFI